MFLTFTVRETGVQVDINMNRIESFFADGTGAKLWVKKNGKTQANWIVNESPQQIRAMLRGDILVKYDIEVQGEYKKGSKQFVHKTIKESDWKNWVCSVFASNSGQITRLSHGNEMEVRQTIDQLFSFAKILQSKEAPHLEE